MKFAAALLLLVIGVHAAPLAAMPIEKVRGSAFSAHTAEVSLAARDDCKVEQRVAVHPQPHPQPLPLLGVLWKIVHTPAAIVGQGPTPLVRDSSLPPPYERLRAQASPRAPPTI
ncbi:hypothetical protein [Novosphingobium sp. M1R2S20]|uniref:Uncharacterized protein n=1 Tax=Novosphingobium rhizovicinum TaxID=3228928 RepID=A0ABV3REU8_9SPHN